MRRFLIVIVVLVLLAVLVDRAAWWFAQRTIADQIQSEADLTTLPDVSVGGFPFLTQVMRGNYEHISANLVDPAVESGLKLDELDIELRGVQVSTSEALKGQVNAVPVDSATAVATVSYDTLNETAKQNLPENGSQVKFGPGTADALRVTGEYRSGGLKLELDLQARLVAEDGDLVVQLPAATLDGLPAAIRPQVRSLVTEASRLPSLPFGFQAQSVSVGASDITVRATSASLKLER